MTRKRDVLHVVPGQTGEIRRDRIVRSNASVVHAEKVSSATASATVLATIILMLGLTACAAPAKKPDFSLDQLSLHFAYSPKQSIGPKLYPDQQAALVRGVTSQANAKGYRILDQRIFVYVGHVREIGPQWVILHADLWTEFTNNYRAKEIERPVRVTELSAAAVWRFPSGGFVEVAQSKPLPDGTALVGYFSLTK
jgi:hypothetical protein